MSAMSPGTPAKRRRNRRTDEGATLEPPEYTIQEAAAKLGVAEQKLRRWDAQGVLVARRTAGGHRRYAREIVDSLAGSVSDSFDNNGTELDELALARRDIKDKRRIIQLLIESESRYRDLVETSHDLIWTTDAFGRFTYVNNGAQDIFGMPPSALIGRCFFDFESQPSHVSNRRFLSTLRREGEVREYLTRLIAADGSERWVGINARVWYDNDQIIGLRGTAHNVTAQHRAALKIEYLATHDALTDLPNQVSFKRALETSLEAGESGAIMRVDVDNFKAFNERYGHAAGDKLLIAVGAILSNVFRDSDASIFRIGGDEFAVLLAGGSRADVESIADAALLGLRQLSPEVPDSNGICQVTGSIGIVEYPSQGRETVTLLDNAERAVNESKVNGRNHRTTYSAGLTQRQSIDRQAYWKTQLRDALDEDRLVLYSQDVASLTHTGRKHRELLARIVGRNGEVIESGEFIGIASSIGLAQEIDMRVLEKIEQYLREQTNPSDGCRYFVNLSGSSAFETSWQRRFQSSLSNASFNRNDLVFEISESTAMSNVEMARRLFSLLREAGCGTAMDNFGTGFGSIYYLKQFDVDYIKIDGSLIRELQNDEGSRLFVRALCDVAAGLNKEVIAECVETQAALDQLQALGVEYAQGYCIGRPRPFNTVDAKVRITDVDYKSAAANLPGSMKGPI